MKLYIDLDQTLVDFYGGVSELLGADILTYLKSHTQEELYQKFNPVPRFYARLKMLDGAREFWDSIKTFNPIILTTAPAIIKGCEQDKKQWVREHLGSDIQVITTTQDKSLYAEKGDVLIDDYKKNIKKWKEAGGVGILFQGNYVDVLTKFMNVFVKSLQRDIKQAVKKIKKTLDVK